MYLRGNRPDVLTELDRLTELPEPVQVDRHGAGAESPGEGCPS
jgi:hypothetical protein